MEVLATAWAGLTTNPGASVTTFGLGLDIVGVWLAASEVVREYHGPRYRERVKEDHELFWAAAPAEPTPEFQAWDRRRRLWMKVGLGILTAGFVLQAFGVWI